MLRMDRLVATPQACNALLLGLRSKAYAGVLALCLLIVINVVIATGNLLLLLLLLAAVSRRTSAVSHVTGGCICWHMMLQCVQPGMHVRCNGTRAVHTYDRCALSYLGLLYSCLPDFSNACLL